MEGSENGFPKTALSRGLQERAQQRCAPAAAATTCALLRGRLACRVAGTESGGRGEDRECLYGGVCACVCACAGVCAPGEVVEASAPWLGACRGGIARFSPAGAEDLQAIPLYFRRKLTSPRRSLERLL